MSFAPKVSVVMSVFNGQLYVADAVRSILDQTFEDFEFIIVDNHSTDGTVDVIESFDDARIVLVRNEKNLGQTKALNIGIRKSKAPYIARMDADDISLPERLEKQYRYMLKHPSIAVLSSQFFVINAKGRIVRKYRLPIHSLEIKSYLLGAFELSSLCVAHPAAMIRTQAVHDAGLYDEKYIAQDYELWVRMSRQYMISNLSEFLYKYRINDESQTRKNSDIFALESLEIIAKNIRYYWPDLPNEHTNRLTRMLAFLPQNSSDEGEQILELFDNFFERAVRPYANEEIALKAKERLKLFYSPLLFCTNRGLAIKTFCKLIVSQPSVLLRRKLYAKIIQSFFRRKIKFTKLDWQSFDDEIIKASSNVC